MAAAIYATPGIEETQKLPTLEAAIVLTTVCTGLLMTFLGHRKLGNIVRLLPSPVTGGFLAGTGWVLTAGAFKVLSGGLPLNFENLNQFFLLGGDKSYEQLMFVTGPGVLLGLTLAVGNRRIGKFWVVPVCLSGGVLGYFRYGLARFPNQGHLRFTSQLVTVEARLRVTVYSLMLRKTDLFRSHAQRFELFRRFHVRSHGAWVPTRPLPRPEPTAKVRVLFGQLARGRFAISDG